MTTFRPKPWPPLRNGGVPFLMHPMIKAIRVVRRARLSFPPFFTNQYQDCNTEEDSKAILRSHHLYRTLSPRSLLFPIHPWHRQPRPSVYQRKILQYPYSLTPGFPRCTSPSAAIAVVAHGLELQVQLRHRKCRRGVRHCKVSSFTTYDCHIDHF